ncbi:MAG: SDR family NAD(P)-dependent oxidoreductase, partial [Candidatus Heimdallarchaeota archaeon]|nr:SDR family NAD(P)-dependent oxidoreductase [Candidatus Heimdallarchaeota archaeon]
MVKKNKETWTTGKIPDLKGKNIVITGANSGLGFEITRVLSYKNPHIIMACRNLEKAENAKTFILKENPEASLEIMQIDLSKQSSVKEFVKEFTGKYEKLDVLFNNAGVMFAPKMITEDGLELHMAANHFGHFTLTGLLMNILEKTENSRIVSIASMGHRFGRINFNELNYEKGGYNKIMAYSNSKIANLYFGYELDRRLKAKGSSVLSVVAHPGWTRTNLQTAGGEIDESKGQVRFWNFMNIFFSQTVDMGVLPQLRAAFDPETKGGEYYSPEKFLHLRGSPIVKPSNKRSRNEKIAKKFWEVSEE